MRMQLSGMVQAVVQTIYDLAVVGYVSDEESEVQVVSGGSRRFRMKVDTLLRKLRDTGIVVRCEENGVVVTGPCRIQVNVTQTAGKRKVNLNLQKLQNGYVLHVQIPATVSAKVVTTTVNEELLGDPEVREMSLEDLFAGSEEIPSGSFHTEVHQNGHSRHHNNGSQANGNGQSPKKKAAGQHGNRPRRNAMHS